MYIIHTLEYALVQARTLNSAGISSYFNISFFFLSFFTLHTARSYILLEYALVYKLNLSILANY